MKRRILGTIVWFIITFAAGAIAALGSVEAREFYASLKQPSWAPPGWVFGPVWTLLYVTMAVSVSLVWSGKGFAAARTLLALYVAQLFLNATWSWIFFVWKMGALAFIDIVFLWILLAVITVLFGKTKRVAAVLLLPYLAWVTFACFLCYAVWILNPSML